MSSPIAWSDVLSLPGAAQLASVGVAAQDAILAYVNGPALNVVFFGGEDSATTKLTRMYLAAHLGLVGPRFGYVSGESEADLSTSYGILPLPVGADPFWYTSNYGAAFQSMVRSSPGCRMPTVGH